MTPQDETDLDDDATLREPVYDALVQGFGHLVERHAPTGREYMCVVCALVDAFCDATDDPATTLAVFLAILGNTLTGVQAKRLAARSAH